ncbi:MAG: C25 family cysteine peptidase [Candidatus Hinthialibacter antarcticus]|nr:C25 family cysteine peptidase [Candidatus Hinthialibacter antarcticus]
MNSFRCRAAVAILLIASFASFSFANRNRPNDPPASSPEFTLLELGAESLVVRYTRPDDSATSQLKTETFIAVPPGAEFTVEPIAWNFRLEHERKFEEPIEGSLADLTRSASDPVAMLGNAFTAKRRMYQELDVIELTFSPTSDSPLSATMAAYKRDKVHLDHLDVKVQWSGGAAQIPKRDSELDAGYRRMFRTLFINHDQAEAMRRKRPPVEDEINQGFHPVSIGYATGAPVTNAAVGQLQPRKDGIRVQVESDAVYAVRPGQLRKLGVDLNAVALDQVRVWHRGEEQPAAILDDDGAFRGEDAICFYGRASDSDYTKLGHYFITWSEFDSAPMRIESKNLTPKEDGGSVLTAEVLFNQEKVLVKKGLRTFDWYYLQMDHLEEEMVLPLRGLAPQGEIMIEVDYYNNMRDLPGFSLSLGDAQKHFRTRPDEATAAVFVVSASGIIENPTFAITLDKKPSINAGPAGLSDKINELQYLFIDSIRVLYSRTIDLNDAPIAMEKTDSVPAAVQLASASYDASAAWGLWSVNEGKLTGHYDFSAMGDSPAFETPQSDWQFLVIEQDKRLPPPQEIALDYASTLHNADQGYDYIIISYNTLMDSVLPLAERRTKGGFKVLLVDIQDIYDEFNFGYPDIEAVKRFLRYGQSVWTGASPEFVLLVGDSSWDHRDNEGSGMIDQVPTYAPLNNPQRFASDEHYAYLWGGESDYYLDVLPGRISLRTPQEVSNYVTKVETYEDKAPVGPWKARNVWVSDDTFERYAARQSETSAPPFLKSVFIDQIDYPHVTNPYLYHRFYGDESASAQEYLNKKYSPETTLAILDNLNQGTSVFQYIGHGGNQLWSHERIFYGTARPTSNIIELQPNQRFPFIMSWSCLTGYLNYNRPPFHICLSEEFIRYPDRGGIAVWGPSGGGTTDQHMVMSHLIMRLLYENGLTRLGEATSFTKTEFMHTYTNSDLIDQYILFGDPAIELNTPGEQLDVAAGNDFYYQGEDMGYQVTAQTAGFDSGVAIVSMSAGRESIYESKPFSFSNSTIQHAFTAAVDADFATAAVRVYAWNKERNLDAWGGTEVSKYESTLSLSNGSVTMENDEAVVEFSVENTSPFLVDGAEYQLYFGATPERISLEPIEPHSAITASWRGALPQGAVRANVKLVEDPYLNITAKQGGGELLLDLPVELEHPIAPILSEMRTSAPDLISGDSVRLRIPFENIAGATREALNAKLVGPGADANIIGVTLDAGRDRTVDFRVDLPEAGTADYILYVSDGAYSNEFPLSLEIFGKPDLAMAEGGLTFEPKQPIVGKTVFFKTTVYNVGDGPANDVRIEAYLGDPAEKQRLLPFNRAQRTTIDRIEPGELASIELRWDPKGYEGAGSNKVFIVADPNDRIQELDESNNQAGTVVTLADLPDLKIESWSDHELKRKKNTKIPIWGEPLEIQARIRNIGDSSAEYVRLSIHHSGKELTRFFDTIAKKGIAETRFEVPLVSSKNTLRIVADQYDLIGEKGEETADDNNASLEKRYDFDLQMPLAALTSGERVYSVTSEDQFTAGWMEFFSFNELEQRLEMIPAVNEFTFRVAPSFVMDESAFNYRNASKDWLWFSRFNVFVSALQEARILPVRLPSAMGTFRVFVKLACPEYEKRDANDAAISGSPPPGMQIKTGGETDYVTIEYGAYGADDGYVLLGEKTIIDNSFLIDFKTMPGLFSSNVSDVRFERVQNGEPVSTDYISPLFPSDGATGRPATLAWEAGEPEGSSITIWARWVNQNQDGSLQYLPWAKRTEASKGKLTLSGKGDYIQYRARFSTLTQDFQSPWLKNLSLRIPGREARNSANIGAAR